MLKLYIFLLVVVVKGNHTERLKEIQRSAVNYWRFDHSTNYTDSVTNVSASYHGNSDDVSFQGNRHGNGYLTLKSYNTTLKLSGITSSCLHEPHTCDGGVTMAMWFFSNMVSKQEVPYLMSDSKKFKISRLRNCSLAISVDSGNITYKTCVLVNTSQWTHLTVTWQPTNGIAVYSNSRLLSRRSIITKVTNYWNRTTYTQSARNHSLVLHGIASYDDVMIWNKVMSSVDIKKIFQSQINSIFQATCHTQVTSLNITWQTTPDVYSSISSYHARLRQQHHRKTLATYQLPKTASEVVFRGLNPITNYRIKIWAQTRDNAAGVIKTQVIKCTTLEGVPEKVINLRATSKLSSAVLVQWLPPFRINGYLKGYKVNISSSDLNQRFIVQNRQSLLIDHLQESTTYMVSVAAINTNAMGPVTAIRIKTKQIPHITSHPQGLTAISNHWYSMNIKWEPMNSSYEAEQYEIRICQEGNIKQCKKMTTKKTLVVMGDLQQCTRYVVDVRAVNRRSKGPWVQHVMNTIDRNECNDGTFICGHKAMCHNTPGSYLCSCLPGYANNGSECTRNDVGSLSVCPYEILDGLAWYSAFKGQYASILCPKGTVGKAVRFCGEKDGRPMWRVPDLEKCTSHRLIKLQEQLSNAHLNTSVFINLVVDLVSATNLNSSLPIYGGDIVATVDIIQRLYNFTATKVPSIDESSQKMFSKSTIHISSNILDETRAKGWTGLPKKSMMHLAYQLVETLEAITLATSTYLETPIIQQAPNIIAKMQSFPVKDKSGDQQLFVASAPNCTISLPIGDAGNLNKGNKTRISFVYLSNIGRLLSSDNSNETTSGEVASLSVKPKLTEPFIQPVVITLQTPQYNDIDNMQPSCVYWNSTSDPPSWSSDGCYVFSSNDSVTICHCYHLTSFAVLMQHVPSANAYMDADHKFALSLITYIGVGISLVALLIAFITFCLCPFLKSTRNFAHINLTFSLLLAEGLFLVGIDKTQYGLGCHIIAVFLHYLFLVVFCWMASEGIILYFMLVRVFPSENSGPRRRLFFVCSWGLPCVFVVLSYTLYPQGYMNEQYCWVTIQDGFIWSFIAPVILISLVNLIFLVMTFKAMSNRLTPQTASKKKTFRHWAKACGVITCLLGTTWLLGLFFVNNLSLVMAYLFNIFNSLQGLFIFIFHCVFDERVRAEYYRVLCCRGTRRDFLRKMSTDPQTSRKMTPMTSRQKYVQCSTEEVKGTSSGITMSSDKQYMEFIQGFDSDSLLTINKTSEEYGLTDDNSYKKVDTLNLPPSQLTEKRWINKEDTSRPLSLDISSKSLQRSKDYYSDSDCANYFSDALSDELSNNEIGSHPKLQDSKGGVVKLGRCRICSNDCYHMVCIGNEDGFTLDSFESEQTPYRSVNFTMTESDDTQGSTNVSHARVSFDESILTGFLRDAHPNPKIISHRWTHVPYIREKDLKTRDFLTESTSCDDCFLNSQQPKIKGHAQSILNDIQTETKAHAQSGTSQEDEIEDHAQKVTVEEMPSVQKPEKPVGLVSPMLVSSSVDRGDKNIPPVASVESIEELDCDITEQNKLIQQNVYYDNNAKSNCCESAREEESLNQGLDILDENGAKQGYSCIKNNQSLDQQDKHQANSDIDTDQQNLNQKNIFEVCSASDQDVDSRRDDQHEIAVARSTLAESCSYPGWHTTLHTIQYQDVPEESIHTRDNINQGQVECKEGKDAVKLKNQFSTASRSEMASIKEGLVRQLGQIYETKFLILHPVTNETENPDIRAKTQPMLSEKQLKRSSKLLPGKVKFLRAIFEDPSN